MKLLTYVFTILLLCVSRSEQKSIYSSGTAETAAYELCVREYQKLGNECIGETINLPKEIVELASNGCKTDMAEKIKSCEMCWKNTQANGCFAKIKNTFQPSL
uniref:Uncharacterized protein n=1 Tax=Clytia hemisphaerica TaxID=252671 RepID=A0A7M5XAL8_9CNID|eukprot:TCONS_00064136-protein